MIPHDFQSLIGRLLDRGLDARFLQSELEGAVLVLHQASETADGLLAGVPALRITQLLNGTWRTCDLVELDEGFSDTEVLDYVEWRLKASRADYDAESTRRCNEASAQSPRTFDLPDPVFRLGEARWCRMCHCAVEQAFLETNSHVKPGSPTWFHCGI